MEKEKVQKDQEKKLRRRNFKNSLFKFKILCAHKIHPNTKIILAGTIVFLRDSSYFLKIVFALIGA